MLSSNNCYNIQAQNNYSENTEKVINQSFIQFNFMIYCDKLVEEHNKYMFTLVNRKNNGI